MTTLPRHRVKRALGLVLGVPPVRDFLGLVAPSAAGWGAVAASSAAAVAISRTVGLVESVHPRAWLIAVIVTDFLTGVLTAIILYAVLRRFLDAPAPPRPAAAAAGETAAHHSPAPSNNGHPAADPAVAGGLRGKVVVKGYPERRGAVQAWDAATGQGL